MNKFFAAVAMIAAPMAANNASAATITYKAQGALPYLQQFDPSFGTLESVTFDNNYVTNAYFQYSNIGSDGRPQPAPAIRVVGTLGTAQFGQTNIDEVFQSIFQAPNLISVNINKTVNATFTGGDLSPYIGKSLLPVGAFSNLTSPGLAPGFASFPTPFSYVSVTYGFTSAIPEASTWAMMLVGFAMVAGTARYRRRSVNVAYA